MNGPTEATEPGADAQWHSLYVSGNAPARLCLRPTRRYENEFISNCELMIANCEMKAIVDAVFFNSQFEFRNYQLEILRSSKT